MFMGPIFYRYLFIIGNVNINLVRERKGCISQELVLGALSANQKC